MDCIGVLNVAFWFGNETFLQRSKRFQLISASLVRDKWEESLKVPKLKISSGNKLLLINQILIESREMAKIKGAFWNGQNIYKKMVFTWASPSALVSGRMERYFSVSPSSSLDGVLLLVSLGYCLPFSPTQFQYWKGITCHLVHPAGPTNPHPNIYRICTKYLHGNNQ